MATLKKKRGPGRPKGKVVPPSPPPAPPQADELISCTTLTVVRVAKPLLRGDFSKTAHGITHPMQPAVIRAGNLAADQSAGLDGYECASCGHLKARVKFYKQIAKRAQARDHEELDAVCLTCRAQLDAYHLHVDNREARLQRGARRQQVVIERQQAKLRAQRATVPEAEKRLRRERAAADKRKKVFKEGTPEAQRELMARELCRRNYARFVQRFEGLELVDAADVERLQKTGKGFHMSWFHAYVCAKLQQFLERIIAGVEPALMLFTPPRHGKSTTASRLFPPWAMGKYPELEIIAASYGSSLPMEFSRFVRSLIQEKAYRALFPQTALAGDSQQLKGWNTTKGGQYLPAGVGTGISGRGADVFVIDDPVKDQEEADSEAIQQRNLEWYLSVAQTRLSPKCGELLIQTRWADNDLAGFLERAMLEELKDHQEQFADERQHLTHNPPADFAARQAALDDLNAREAEQRGLIKEWEIIPFPAIATQEEYITEDLRLVHEPEPGARHVRSPGDALHPERYSKRRLERTRRVMVRTGKTRLWHALFQTDPAPDSGEYFSKDMFPEEVPLHPGQFARWTIVQAWDPAIGEKQTNDWTVGGTGALDPWGRLHVLHMVRLRKGPAEIAEAMIEEYAFFEDCTQTGVHALGIEHGQISLALVDSLEHALKEANKQRKAAGKKELPPPRYLKDERALKPVQDKLVRARPSQGWHRSGRVLYPQGVSWTEQHHREHYRFMTGYQWDDCVDFTSWLVRVARDAPLPRTEEKQSKPRYGKYQSWRRRLRAKTHGERSHMGA